MKQLVNAYSIANAVRLNRASNKTKSAALVEGYKDVRLFANLFNETRCSVTPAMSKSNAVSALRLLRTGGVKGVFAIIDSDFSSILGPDWDDPDIITTETHDSEGMLLQSPALEKIIVEYSHNADTLGTDLRHRLLEATRPLGYLRLASERGQHRLNFEKLDFKQFIVRNPIGCDLQRMADEAALKSTNSRFSAAQMLEEIKELYDPKHDPWVISCGHDMTSTLAEALTGLTQREVPNYTVERQLRLAYEKAHFPSTKLHQKIKAWEQRNAPFMVL